MSHSWCLLTGLSYDLHSTKVSSVQSLPIASLMLRHLFAAKFLSCKEPCVAGSTSQSLVFESSQSKSTTCA